jgi:hypothetical protein
MDHYQFNATHGKKKARQQELEATLHHALALAGPDWAGDEARPNHHEHGRRAHKLGRLSHLVGYATLFGYIVLRRPVGKPYGLHLTLFPIVKGHLKSHK